MAACCCRMSLYFFAYFFATIVVVLLSSGQSDACSCFPSHPQELFCNSEFVVRAIITSPGRKIHRTSTDKKTKWTSIQHSSTILHVFRGKEAISSLLLNKKLNKLPESLKYADINITTPASDSLCGVHLNFTKTYLIFGQIRNREMEVTLCNFISVWESVINPVKRGIHGDYDCHCKIETRMENEDTASWKTKDKKMIEKEKKSSGSVNDSLTKAASMKRTSEKCYWDMYPDEPVDECALNFVTCRRLVNPMVIDNETEACVWVEGTEYQDCKQLP